jgi:hypothetical protein
VPKISIGDKVRIKESPFAEDEDRVPLPVDEGWEGYVEAKGVCGYTFIVGGYGFFADEVVRVED